MLVSLAECPPGLFVFGLSCLGFKSEYKTESQSRPGVWQSDAYVVESGEYFWGGTSNAVEREELLVTPLSTTVQWPKIEIWELAAKQSLR
jgi:hypothetical protein